jgi:uncharacterized protein (UPF0332 family)
MMRSPDLPYCLDSPYLWYDDSAANMVAKDLEAADKFAKEMRGQKDMLEQINVAYQAMYCATQALIHSINYKVSGFRCVVTVLEEFFVSKGILDRGHLANLIRGQKIEGTPQENFDAAEAYIAAVKEIVKK